MKNLLFAAIIAALHSCNAQPAQPRKTCIECDAKKSAYCVVIRGTGEKALLCALRGECSTTINRYDRLAEYVLQIQHLDINGNAMTAPEWVQVSPEQFAAAKRVGIGGIIELKRYLIDD